MINNRKTDFFANTISKCITLSTSPTNLMDLVGLDQMRDELLFFPKSTLLHRWTTADTKKLLAIRWTPDLGFTQRVCHVTPRHTKVSKRGTGYDSWPKRFQLLKWCLFIESTIQAKVNHDLGNLRTKQKHYHERVPQERLDEYDSSRMNNADRKQKLINNRFPELSAAREAFLGKDPS